MWLRAEQCFLRPPKKKVVKNNAGVCPERPVLHVWRTIWLCQPPEEEKISFENLNRGRAKEPVYRGWAGTRKGEGRAACPKFSVFSPLPTPTPA